jgi:hypothetical protein
MLDTLLDPVIDDRARVSRSGHREFQFGEAAPARSS